jgi:hypothetical protein
MMMMMLIALGKWPLYFLFILLVVLREKSSTGLVLLDGTYSRLLMRFFYTPGFFGDNLESINDCVSSHDGKLGGSQASE